MTFVSVRDFRNRSADVWRRLEQEQQVVVTSSGRPIAILSAVSGETLQETLAALRRSRAIAAVTELQRESVARGRDALGPAEIEAEIRAARQSRGR